MNDPQLHAQPYRGAPDGSRGLILGIESSCDETAAAVVRAGRDVLSNVIASQDALHVEYGGVVPEIASRAHVERILPVVRRALRDANVTLAEIDAVAVGHRPGLIGSLLVGVAAGKALAWSLDKPLIGIDHIHAHLYACALDCEQPAFPAVGLVVSGGHASLYHLDSWLKLRRIGSTIDDAIGEAYDKVATILGLEYPGGPKLDKLAQTGDERAHDFPVSLLEPGSLDFSYSGLKTAVLYQVRGKPVREGGATKFERDASDLTEKEKADVAASFQRAAVEAVVKKVERALVCAGGGGTGVSPIVGAQVDAHGRNARSTGFGAYKSLLVGGGVSANSRLRAELPALAARHDVELRMPAMRYCLDNAAMIAGLAFERLSAGLTDDLTLQAIPTTAC